MKNHHSERGTAVARGQGRATAIGRGQVWLICWLCTCCTALPQTPPTAARGITGSEYIAPTPEFLDVVKALGTRVTRQGVGKERTIYSGVLTDSRGTANFQFVWEAPGNFRYLEGGASERRVTFDGATASGASGAISEVEQDLVESLALDSTLALLFDCQNGRVALRVLGRRFRQQGDIMARSYTGPEHDVYETTGPSVLRKDGTMQRKLFFFDSRTQLLERVEYTVRRGSADIKVVVTNSGWTKVNGEAFPGVVTRSEDGRVKMTFRITSAGTEAKVVDNLFGRVP